MRASTWQSVHGEQVVNSAPELPSSQSPSDEKAHVFTHVPLPGGPGMGEAAGDGAGGGEGAGDGHEPESRGPQSKPAARTVQRFEWRTVH